MFTNSNTSQMPMEEFLVNPTAPILIDVRGSLDSDPAIPGSKRVYLRDIAERTEAFEKRFAPQMANRSLLLYCSKGRESHLLAGQFSGKYRVQSLQGGMVSYLTTISHLLHEHPYEDPEYREETMVKILTALTNRGTDAAAFQKITSRLLRYTPNPKFSRLQQTPSASLQKIVRDATPDKSVFLVFSGKNCSLCTVLRQYLPWFAETYRNQINVVVVDVQKHAGLAMEYAIHSIPTVIVYKNGAKILKEVAVSSKEKLKEMVQFSTLSTARPF